MYCPRCATTNDASATYCVACRSVLPEPVVERGSDEWYAALIGRKSQHYYLREFGKFDAVGKAGYSWNWAACLITLYWLLYRKMWVPALRYGAVVTGIIAIVGLIGTPSSGIGMFIAVCFNVACLIAIFAVPGLFGNALYYRYCLGKIDEQKSVSDDIDRQLSALNMVGGTSPIAAGAAVFVVVLLILGAATAIAFPAYQRYAAQARLADINRVGSAAAQAVETYYFEQNKIPATLSDTGYNAALPPYLSKIEVDGSTAIITMTVSIAPLSGKKLLMIPKLDDNRQVHWKCISHEIDDAFLPAPCRKK